MRLTERAAPGPPTVRIHDRIRQELRDRPLPSAIRLEGTPMRIAIATRLLTRHAPDTRITDEGEPVRLWSLESYGGAILSHLLERTPLPSGHRLLHTIPDAVQRSFADATGIAKDPATPPDGAEDLLLRIAATHPQAPFTLVRSAERLVPERSPDTGPQRTSTGARQENR